MADTAHAIQPREPLGSAAFGERPRRLRCLIKHPDQSVKVTLILKTDVMGETRRSFTIEHRHTQVIELFGVAMCQVVPKVDFTGFTYSYL